VSWSGSARASRRALFALCASISLLGGGFGFVLPDLPRAWGEYIPPLRWRNVMFDHMPRAVNLIEWLPDGTTPSSAEYRPAADWLPVASLGYGEARVTVVSGQIPSLLRMWCRARPELEGVLWRTRRYDLEPRQRSAALEPPRQRFERCRRGRLVTEDLP